MSLSAIIFGIIVFVSIAYMALLIREFHNISAKRAALVRGLGGEGKYLRSNKAIMIWTYVIFSVLWPCLLSYGFFRLFAMI